MTATLEGDLTSRRSFFVPLFGRPCGANSEAGRDRLVRPTLAMTPRRRAPRLARGGPVHSWPPWSPPSHARRSDKAVALTSPTGGQRGTNGSFIDAGQTTGHSGRLSTSYTGGHRELWIGHECCASVRLGLASSPVEHQWQSNAAAALVSNRESRWPLECDVDSPLLRPCFLSGVDCARALRGHSAGTRVFVD